MLVKVDPDNIGEEFKFMITWDSNGVAYMDSEDISKMGVIIAKMKVERLKNKWSKFKNGLKKSVKDNEDI